jgi:hypothetical protein
MTPLHQAHRHVGDLANRVSNRLLRLQHERHLDLLEPGAWSDFRGLLPTSTALVGCRGVERAATTVHLLLPPLTSASVFAGVRTAVVAGAGLAHRLGLDLRIITFAPDPSRHTRAAVTNLVHTETDLARERVSFRGGWTLSGTDFSTRDIWVPTYWSTAHAVDVACRVGTIDPARVAYLVQDYEPDFLPNSTEASLAAATYEAGFRLVVNSRPLHAFLQTQIGSLADDAAVFRPELDVVRLRAAAERRSRTGTARVAFYGRPGKPRNAFSLGVAALRVANRQQKTGAIDYTSVGQPHATIDLGGGTLLRGRGQLSWQGWFDFLAETDVLLSLQLTPHPSHPPLDAVASGGRAVTNELGGTRGHLSPRLIAAPSDPSDLGAAVVEACERARADDSEATYDGSFVESLGRPLGSVLDELATSLA